jgi:hypothetical protein
VYLGSYVPSGWIELAGRVSVRVLALYYGGKVGYEWDGGALEWIARNGLEPGEVLQVLNGRKWPRVGLTPEGLRVLTLWGRTRAGKGIVVMVRSQSGRSLDAWIVNARTMTVAEQAEFLAWEESQA